MNTENTACPHLSHLPVVEKIAIDAEEQYSLPEDYETMDFSNIEYGLTRFIEGLATIYFHDYIGHLYLKGNVLLYYPRLAKKIHALKLHDYPFLKQNYKVDARIKGVSAFLKYFSQYTLQCFRQFQTDLTQMSNTVNNWIALYGNARCIPLIEGIESCDNQKYLVVHGVRWRLAKGDNNFPITESLDLCALLKLCNSQGHFHERGLVALEDATPGTPFIALRIQNTWRHKGRVVWYDLNTKQPIRKAERMKWKDTLEEGKTAQNDKCPSLLT